MKLEKCYQCNGSGRYFRENASFSTRCEKCNGEGKIEHNGDSMMNIEQKYDQALEVIVGLSTDIQELKDTIADRTNDIIHQQEEIERLKSDAKYFADERNYGSIVLENADLIKFRETTKRVVGDFIFNTILEEMEDE